MFLPPATVEDCTKVTAFITSRIDYCYISVLHGVSAVHLRPLQNVLNSAETRTQSHYCWHSGLPPLAASSTEDRVQDVRAYIQVSTSVITHLPLRVMHPSCSISRTVSLTFSCARNLIISYCRTRPKRYGQRSFAFSWPVCSVEFTSTDYGSFHTKLSFVRN